MRTDIFDYKTQTETAYVFSLKDALSDNFSVVISSIVMLKRERAYNNSIYNAICRGYNS